MNKKEFLQTAKVRLHDMKNLFEELFVDFSTTDSWHAIEVYSGLGYALGDSVKFLQENKKSFENPGEQSAVAALIDQTMRFMQTLADIINYLRRKLELPEGLIEQGIEQYKCNILPLLEDLNRLVSDGEDFSSPKNKDFQDADSEFPVAGIFTQSLSLIIQIFVSLVAAFVIAFFGLIKGNWFGTAIVAIFIGFFFGELITAIENFLHKPKLRGVQKLRVALVFWISLSLAIYANSVLLGINLIGIFFITLLATALWLKIEGW